MEQQIKRDGTKSIAWQALDKATREDLVTNQLDFLTAKTMNINDAIAYNKRLEIKIHRALGMEQGDLAELHSSLRTIVNHYKGSISKEIETYLNKFDEIKNA